MTIHLLLVFLSATAINTDWFDGSIRESFDRPSQDHGTGPASAAYPSGNSQPFIAGAVTSSPVTAPLPPGDIPHDQPGGGAFATSYYMEVNGDDVNLVLLGALWRTLANACNTVDADLGHIINIGEGTFTETEILKLYNYTLIVPTNGAWENGMAPAISAEFLGMALKDCEIFSHTIIDHGGIGRIFALHESSSYEARNNLILRTLDPKDIWATDITGKVSHNFFSNVTPRGENAMTGDPGITLAEGKPLRPLYYTFAPDAPVLDKGETISPMTDGFTGTAPDPGAIENGVPFIIPGAG